MKRQPLTIAKTLFLSGALLLPLCGARAAIVYENITTSLNQYYATNAEFGDQITLGGTDRTLTRFSFEAYSPTAGQTYLLRLYLNDGAGGAPGTPLTDFTPQPLTVGYQTYNVDFTLPLSANELTWTVQFSSQDAGLRLFDPPTIGSSLDNFWQNNAGAWSLMNIPGTVANFNAQVTAVPEPGTLALGALGLVLGIGARLRRRSS